MSDNAARKKGKKNRKHGRFKLRCAAYMSSLRREKNKARKLYKHLRHHPTDNQAKGKFANLARFHPFVSPSRPTTEVAAPLAQAARVGYYTAMFRERDRARGIIESSHSS